MITLGRRSFSGPFLSPLWLPAKGAGVFAVLVPGWRLLTFRALHFACAEDFAAPGLLKSHPRYAEWVRIAGCAAPSARRLRRAHFGATAASRRKEIRKFGRMNG